MFHKEYAEVFAGDAQWQAIEVPQAATYVWQADSTYIQHPPFFDDIGGPPRRSPTSKVRGSWRCWVTR